MTRTLDEQIEDYLNGQLSDEKTRRFEGNLMKKEVATAFREALILKILLSDLPPDDAPPGLTDRIEASLDLNTGRQARRANSRRTSRWENAVNGFSWGWRWPRYALAGIAIGPNKMKSSLSGMDTIAYSLGPLNEPVRNRASAIKMPQKSLWKIVLSIFF